MFLFFPSAQQDHPPFPFWASLSSSHCTPQNRAQLPLLSDSSCTAHQLLNNKANPLPASPHGPCVSVPLVAPLLGCSSLSTLLPSCNNHTPDTAFQAGSNEQQVNPGFPAGILVFLQAVLKLMEHRTQLSPPVPARANSCPLLCPAEPPAGPSAPFSPFQQQQFAFALQISVRYLFLLFLSPSLQKTALELITCTPQFGALQ